MLYRGPMDYVREEGEPALRSCPECNEAHERLRHKEFLQMCFVCGRQWIHGRYLDDGTNGFASKEEMDDFLKEHLGVAPPKESA